MPRQFRRLATSGIYHVMIRGNERKNIFLDDEDRLRFIDTVQEKKIKGEYFLYSYCLMDNHVHLVLRENQDGLHRIMKRINTSYAYYFNKKYKRVGHVFQDRFKSECIESDGQLLTVIRYVHNNPVKANLVKQASQYKWSSYNLIVMNSPKDIGVIERNEILDFFSPVKETAVKLFIEYTNKFSDGDLLDVREEKVTEINEENADEFIERYLEKNKITRESLNDEENAKHRKFLIKEIKEKSNLSIRKIAELLNINRGVVQRICVSKEPSH